MHSQIRAPLCASAIMFLSACSSDIFSYPSTPEIGSVDSSLANPPPLTSAEPVVPERAMPATLSATAPATVSAVTPPLQDSHCRRLAEQRAEDAVMAQYVARNSEARNNVYTATYHDCVAWETRRGADR